MDKLNEYVTAADEFIHASVLPLVQPVLIPFALSAAAAIVVTYVILILVDMMTFRRWVEILIRFFVKLAAFGVIVGIGIVIWARYAESLIPQHL